MMTKTWKSNSEHRRLRLRILTNSKSSFLKLKGERKTINKPYDDKNLEIQFRSNLGWYSDEFQIELFKTDFQTDVFKKTKPHQQILH